MFEQRHGLEPLVHSTTTAIVTHANRVCVCMMSFTTLPEWRQNVADRYHDSASQNICWYIARPKQNRVGL